MAHSFTANPLRELGGVREREEKEVKRENRVRRVTRRRRGGGGFGNRRQQLHFQTQPAAPCHLRLVTTERGVGEREEDKEKLNTIKLQLHK